MRRRRPWRCEARQRTRSVHHSESAVYSWHCRYYRVETRSDDDDNDSREEDNYA